MRASAASSPASNASRQLSSTACLPTGSTQELAGTEKQQHAVAVPGQLPALLPLRPLAPSRRRHGLLRRARGDEPRDRAGRRATPSRAPSCLRPSGRGRSSRPSADRRRQRRRSPRRRRRPRGPRGAPARTPRVRGAKRSPPRLDGCATSLSQSSARRSPTAISARRRTTDEHDRTHLTASPRCPTNETLADTVVALEEHGFSVEVVDDLERRARSRPRPHPRRLLGDDQHLGDAAGDRHRGGDRRRRTLRVGAQQDDGARLRDPAAGDEGDRRPARLRPRQRPRDHPRRNARHRLGLRQPARLLRLGRRQRHLRRRRAEARPHPGSGARADLRAQPASSRTPARTPPTGRTAASARSSRSTRRTPAASTSSSSGSRSASETPETRCQRNASRPWSRSTRRSITSAAQRAARLILEYGDYECPYSRQAFHEIERVERDWPDGIRFAFRHFPLTEIHPHALAAAAAAEAAALQDRFWDMHELLFHRQKALEDDDLQRYAAQLGLDVARFDRDRSGAEVLGAYPPRRRERTGVRRGAGHTDPLHRRRRPPRRLRRRDLDGGIGPMSAICTHTDTHQGDGTARRDRRMRRLPRDRGNVGAPAHVHVLRQDRLLRLLAEPARNTPRRRVRPPDHPLRRAGRGLELVLPRQPRVRARLRHDAARAAPERLARDEGHAASVRQIVGKIRLATTPPRNHWWNVPLYVDVRGLTTRRLHHRDTTFEITIDFLDHALVVGTADGRRRSFPLGDGLPVADFDTQLHAGSPNSASTSRSRSSRSVSR